VPDVPASGFFSSVAPPPQPIRLTLITAATINANNFFMILILLA
jgi:hypothetical protein